MRGLFPPLLCEIGKGWQLALGCGTAEFSTDHSHVGSPDWLSRDLTGAELGRD